MQSAALPSTWSTRRIPSRRRATAFALTLAVHLLVGLLVLMMPALRAPPRKLVSEPTSFTLLPERPAPAAARAPEERKRSASKPRPPAPPARSPLTPPDAPPAPAPFLVLNRAEFAASDISKLPSHTPVQTAGGAGTGADSGGAAGPGDGPGGARLYDADWYRKPTNAELAQYMPSSMPDVGWGLVACQTIARNRVENCRELGESPRGSGLARAVRLAAWQFQVLPPRIDGRPVLGAWVRIRIEYTQGVLK